MELVKNVFFNTDKLVENAKVKISYVGKLFQENSSEVYLHYGFGSNWDNVNEIKMEKTELGFQAEIELIESDTFNFCFRNEKNEWDNNNYENYIFELEPQNANYIFPIEKVELALVVQEQNDNEIVEHRRLRKSYIWSKKVRLAIYKVITYLPKLISGNYKRKVEE